MPDCRETEGTKRVNLTFFWGFCENISVKRCTMPQKPCIIFFELKEKRINTLAVFLELHQNRIAYLIYFLELTIIPIWGRDGAAWRYTGKTA